MPYTKDQTIKLLEISNEILEIVEDRDQMDNGDYQGAIEAQVMNAFLYGKSQEQNRLIDLNDAIKTI